MRQEVSIPIPEKISTNSIYAGKHWTFRKRYKEQWLWCVRSVKTALQKVETYPVRLTMTFYLSGNVLDSSNTSYMGKMIEDALREIGVIADDTWKHVDSVTYKSRKCPKGSVPYVVLEIEGI
jgi:hypothetical protein